MKLSFELLVVLTPAIACALVGIAIEVLPRVYARIHTMMHHASDVEWINHLVMHSAYYGTVVGTILGLKKESHETALAAGVWFVALLYVSRLLCARIAELEEKEASANHRRMAGTTRSIVRDELEKARNHKHEDWTD